MARDQVGASNVYYDLVRAGRPLNEIVAEGVRIHAPYTHVPYHERIDDGYPNFVNNDHCLLSARATINLSKMLPGHLSMLPMAQTIWYIPSGLDIWNQKINKAPGHYTRSRGNLGQVEAPPAPVVYWPDQEPLRENAPLRERLNNWMTLVHRGNVIDAYRVFLGLMELTADRKEVLAEMCFAGLIDVQDRMLHNRSYTTGHKAYRARSTVEIGNAIGWDNPAGITWFMPARWISRSGRAGIRPTRWPATCEDEHRGRGAARRALRRRQRRRNSRCCGRPGPMTPGGVRRTDPRGDPRRRDGRAGLRDQAAEGRQESAAHPGCAADRLRAGRAGDAGSRILQHAAPLLRIPQHARLVLGQFRSSAPAAAALRGGVVPQPHCVLPARPRRGASVRGQGAGRRGPAERGAAAGARRCGGVFAERPGKRRLDAGLSATTSPTVRRWCSASPWPRPSWATIRTTRKSPSAC